MALFYKYLLCLYSLKMFAYRSILENFNLQSQMKFSWNAKLIFWLFHIRENPSEQTISEF